jgi:hypothetical protein
MSLSDIQHADKLGILQQLLNEPSCLQRFINIHPCQYIAIV